MDQKTTAPATSEPAPPPGRQAANPAHRMFAPAAVAPLIVSWCDELATGLPEVDAEHRRLIELINELGGLLTRRATATELGAALVELRQYTVYHFDNEADLMRRHAINAAHRDAHLAAHRGFVEQLNGVEVLAASDVGAALEQLLAFLAKWVVQHVSGVDARMAREIKAAQAGTPVASGAPEDSSAYQTLLNTVGELYANMGARTFELLQANHRLQAEVERRRRADEALRLAAMVFDTVDEGVVVTDANNRIVAVNQSFCRITGYTEDEVDGENPRMLAGGVHPPGFYRDMWSALNAEDRWQGEICNRRKNGELFVEWLSIKRLRDEAGGITHHLAVFSDLTEHRIETDRIRRLAHYDLLTGLPNRALFADRARQALSKARREKSELAVMFIDLDLFKQINDTLGHAVGDLLLKAAAARMQDCLRGSDTVARIGGDEFVVLVPDVESAENAMSVALKIRHALARPFQLSGRSLRVSCSLGIALFPGHGADQNQLLSNADTAMYRAKSRGRNRVEIYRHDFSKELA